MPVPLQVKGRLLIPFLDVPNDPTFPHCRNYSAFLVPVVEAIPVVEEAIKTAAAEMWGNRKLDYNPHFRFHKGTGYAVSEPVNAMGFKCLSEDKPFLCNAAGAPGEPVTSFFSGQNVELGLSVYPYEFGKRQFPEYMPDRMRYHVVFELKAVRLTSESTAYQEPRYEWKNS